MVRDALAIRLAPAAGASLVVGLVAATRPLGPVPRAIALSAVAVSWGTAALLRDRSIRAHASVVAAIAAAVAAGQVDAGRAYGAACAILVLACATSMRAARRAIDAPPPKAEARAIAFLAAIATVVATGLIAGLPRIAAIVEGRITAMFGGDGAEQTAFSTTMVLGSTRGMLQSDTIVMRIDGKRPDYLRGAVYDRYEPPFWVTTAPGRRRRTIAAAASPEAVSEVTLVRGAPNGDDMRWFLPAGACDVGVASGHVEIDAFGVARRARAEDPQIITFRMGCSTREAPIAGPSTMDLDVPPRIWRALGPIAAGWTAGAKTDREKLAAIQAELARFEYSLDVPRTSGIDPIVDFVSVHRAGHCEMFASAMALMARMRGIPTRVVGGYRVTEVNPLTSRAVVRERNAHAWVEAWFDGAWHGMDPTPMSESFAPTPGVADHVGDVIASGLERIAAALTRLGLIGTAAVLGGVVAALLAIRWIGGKIRLRATSRGSTSRAATPPLPCFDTLTNALAQSGVDRDAAEPLESFARRLRTLEPPWAHEASTALLAYASLRYGGVGDEASVVRSVDRAAKSVCAGRRP